ncbi:MAG TPA: glycogen synthase GlgA [Nitrospirota bacterium]|nr:glycogen synthase GlgA [Nitrospirota bacterium]
MKILFAASEAAPFAKTGGLADVAGSLPAALASLGHDVRVVIPRYRKVDSTIFSLKPIATFSVPLGDWQERCDVFQTTKTKNVTNYFIGKDIFFDRPELYGTAKADYPDNAERFIFFSRAVLELCDNLNFEPDIVHCNDWQTGLIPIYLKQFYRKSDVLNHAKIVFTVHNLGYQGLFPREDMRLTGLGWDVFTPSGIEYWGKINFLKAGLVYSDIITTVSRTYSQEIQTPEYGYGLEGVLAKRKNELHGIVNGIDYLEFDPRYDHEIAKTYSASTLTGKYTCKMALQNMVGLPLSDNLLAGMVTRLAEQKGLDIVLDALSQITALDVHVIILGTGDEAYHKLLAKAENDYKNKMRVLLQYNDKIAKSIYAGCDLYLMPSLYEPCGLGQMIALRYGTVPLVRRTGGLVDTVSEYNPKTKIGTGFLFEEYAAPALVSCLQRAVDIYKDRQIWKHLVRNGMKQDFSWARSAQEYVHLYQRALGAQ